MTDHRPNIEHAWYQTHRIEVVEILKRKLETKTYEPKPLRTFIVYEPKKREVQAPSIADKIVQNLLVDEGLYEELTKPFITDTYSSVKGRGTLFGLNRLKKFMAEAYRQYGSDCWVLKCDIRKFFASINQDDILLKAKRYVSDPDVFVLLEKYIRAIPSGLALGLRTSQPLANLELSWMDHKIKEYYKCKWYGRYSDDFFIIHHDKEELRSIKNYLTDDLNSVGLEFNDKTQIFPLAHGIDCLGFRTYLTDDGKVIRQVRDRSRQKMNRKLGHYIVAYREGTITKRKIDASYGSWRNGHAKHGNCGGLIEKYDKKYERIFLPENK